MLQPRLIPILLLKNRRLEKSKNFGDWKYVGDPATAIKVFNEKEVDEICVLDVSARTRSEGPDFELITRLASEAFVPLSYGGGVRNAQEAESLVRIGIDKIIVNSKGFDNPEIFREISSVIGVSSTVCSVDVVFQAGKWMIFDHRTSSASSTVAEFAIEKAIGCGAGEILVQDVERDGTKAGLNLDLSRMLSEKYSVPVIVAGGLSSLEEAKQAWHMGISGVGGGSFFVFLGNKDSVMLTYPQRENGWST